MQYYNNPKIKFSMTTEAQTAICAFFDLQKLTKAEFIEKYTQQRDINSKFFCRVAAFIAFELPAFSVDTPEMEAELLEIVKAHDFEIQETFYEYHLEMCNEAPVEAGMILLYLTLRQTLPNLMPELQNEVSEKLDMIIADIDPSLNVEAVNQKAVMMQPFPADVHRVVVKIIDSISNSLTELLG